MTRTILGIAAVVGLVAAAACNSANPLAPSHNSRVGISAPSGAGAIGGYHTMGPHHWCYVDEEGGPCTSPIYYTEPPTNATIAVLD
jgi:hypothetical protein